MKYGEYKTRKELCIYICSELTNTINTMGDSDGLESELDMFKAPRARKKDLIAKRKAIILKYNLTHKDLI